MHIKPSLVALFAFVSILIAAGCGGSLDKSPSGDVLPAGTFTGHWEAPNADTNGTARLTVDADRNVTGTVYDAKGDRTGNLSGTVTKEGDIAVVVKYGNGDEWTLNGRLRSDSAGHYAGTFRLKLQDGTTVNMTIALTQV